MFDINAGCGRWALRPTPAGDPVSLERILRADGITKACTYPLEAYFWPDPQEANELHLPKISEMPFYVPSAVLNPILPRCLRDYSICRQNWRVPMIRLLPSYHMYKLDDPCVKSLAAQMEADGVVLGVHLRAEDPRNQNPLINLFPLSFMDVVGLASLFPRLRIVVIGLHKLNEVNELLPPKTMGDIAKGKTVPAALPDNMWIELSFFEESPTLETALLLFPPERLLFGTHAPIFYPRANVNKMHLSTVSDSVKESVSYNNARQLLGVR